MSKDTQELEQQVTQLQTQMAFQEDAVAALDSALSAQQQEILLLRRQLELLQQRLAEQITSAEVGGESAGDEKPPHY